jgi:3'(2'), 5'-bisphosphate nucleotidase
MKLSDIARKAGKITLAYFRTSTEVAEKADGSPVTKADQEAEAYIVDALRQLYPDIPFIGEESCTNAAPSQLKRYWCVDPLDGTREFINNRPEYTVNIALVEDGYPIAGVIYAPALDHMYIGSMETGSYMKSRASGVFANHGFQRLPLTADNMPFTVVMSRMHPTAGAEQGLLAELKAKRPDMMVRVLGSSIKFCMVADGSADMYFRAGRTMFWDSAAGHIIAKAAGCKVVRWDSREELVYNTDALENPAFLVYNPKRWNESSE